MKKLIAGIFTLVLLSSAVFAQKADDKEGHYNNTKKIMLADALMQSGSYYNAIDYYLEVYNDDKKIDVAYKLANAYYLARDYKNSEKWYKTVWDAAKDKYPDAEYYLAMSLKANAKYDAAKTEFKGFQKNSKAKGTDIPALKRDAKNQEKGCDLALALVAQPIKVNIEHLNSDVNHNYTDFSPSYDPDNNLTYASLVADEPIDLGATKKVPDNRIARIYTSKREGDKWSKAEVMNEPFNKTNAHTGNGSYSPDGKRFYYTECEPNDALKMVCKIFMSEKKNGDSRQGRQINEVNTSDGTTTTHPCVGSFKGKEVLYFSSNRTGGAGGMDLWYSEITKNGDEYGNPQNCGRKVNTAGDEITPFYSVAKDTMYFSSNGHINIGGLDIYKAKGGEKNWDDPENAGYPLNSSVDDFYYSESKNGRKGFLVSNRPGGFSVKSETCCDDIYALEYIIPPKFAIMGLVYDEDTKAIVPGASVTLFRSGNTEGQAISSEKQYYFWLGTQFDNYELTGEKEGYYKGRATSSTIGMVDDDTLYVDIYMKPLPPPDKPVEVKNIFYELNKADLRPESIVSLDSLYNILVAAPQIIVELGSHTDYRNTDAYNQDLSQRRAQSVVNYLLQKGIDSSRMVAKGYGEGVPKTLVEDFSLPSGKVVPKGTTLDPSFIDKYKKNKEDYEALMQLNRRTEFRVIGNIPGVIIKYDQGQIDAENARLREEQEKANQQSEEEKKKLMDLQKVEEGNVDVQQDNTNQTNNTNNTANTNTNTKKDEKKEVSKAVAGVDTKLTKKGNIYEGSALVNGVASKYLLNQNPNVTCMVSKEFFIQLQSAGTVKDSDFKNDKPTDLGNGTTAKGDIFVIHTLQLGDAVIENVECKLNTTITTNIVVGVKIINANGCSVDEKNLKLKCK